MDTVNLGRTGIKVSRICLGCMTYGSSSGGRGCWTRRPSRPFFRRAWEAGINFFDTADMYSDGVERGGARPGAAAIWPIPREQVVVATKVFNPMGADRRTSAACRASTSATPSTPA